MQKSKSKKRIVRSREEIRNIVREFESSGLTQTAFSRLKGIHQTVLGRWIRRERVNGARKPLGEENRAIPVHIRPPKARAKRVDSAPFEVVLKNGLVVRVPARFDESSLTQLISVLTKPC